MFRGTSLNLGFKVLQVGLRGTHLGLGRVFRRSGVVFVQTRHARPWIQTRNLKAGAVVYLPQTKKQVKASQRKQLYTEEPYNAKPEALHQHP